MKEWKLSQNTRKVYEDLYKSSDPDDTTSDTYVALIIKSVFAVKKNVHMQMAFGFNQFLKLFLR